MIIMFDYSFFLQAVLFINTLESFINIYYFKKYMNYFSQEQERINIDEESYKNNFESSCGSVARKVLILHTFQYLIHAHQQQEKRLTTKESFKTEDTKQIRFQDTSEYIGKQLNKHLETVLQQKQGELLDEYDMFKILISTFKEEILIIAALLIMEIAGKIVFTVFLYQLLNNVFLSNFEKAYINTGIISAVWFISELFKKHANLYINYLNTHIKTGLSLLLFLKVSKMISHTLVHAEAGKIINLLSNDLSVMENRFWAIGGSLVFPFFLIGNTVLLVFYIGWAGLLIILFICIMVALSILISNWNGSTKQKINEFKDRRIQITSEIIDGIKYVKYYGWEFAFKKIITQIRQSEIASLIKLAFGKAIQRGLVNSFSYFNLVNILIVAASLGVKLTFSSIYMALYVMANINNQVFYLTQGIGLYYELKIVFSRFASTLNMDNRAMIKREEKNENNTSQPQFNFAKSLMKQSQSQSLKNGEILFTKFNGYRNQASQVPFLKNIDIFFKSKQLYGISGKIGSGKSSFLAAILGETPFYSGDMQIFGKIAYVEQEPIIFADTIKNNIIFGKQYNHLIYAQIIQQACLKSDFEILPRGDETILGEKGITLSGGQKARLSLARALYSKADIYLLDDPISAVDSKVAKVLFQKCLRPLSQQKTVLLTTHLIGYLYSCDYVILLQEGQIISKGTPSSLRKQLNQLSEIYRTNDDQENESQIQQESKKQNYCFLQQQIEVDPGFVDATQLPQGMKTRLIEKQININIKTYSNFLFSSKANYVVIPMCLILLVSCEVCLAIYLKMLSHLQHVLVGKQTSFGEGKRTYWIMLGGMTIAYFFLLIMTYFSINLSIFVASKRCHQKMIQALIRCPASYFDQTPSSILINKFSNDLGIIDLFLSFDIIYVLNGTAKISIAVVVMCLLNPILIVPAIITLLIVLILFFYAKPVIIQCKKLDLQNKNPIFHASKEYVNGLTQIRIYNQRFNKIQQFYNMINNSSRSTFAYDIVSNSFGIYSSFVWNIFIVIAFMLSIGNSNQHEFNYFGILSFYLITISEFLDWTLSQFINVESLMVSAQKVMHFDKLPRQNELRNNYDKQIGLAQQIQSEERQEDFYHLWPQISSLEVKQLSAKYKQGLPLVLKNISFQVRPGEKIGIVGRTGAGKSSIIQVLFRIIQPEACSVYQIDSYNALEMGLHSLRKHISVIPQVPFLFKGSVRQNIDPFGTFQDAQQWQALKESGLDSYVQSLPDKLSTEISSSSGCFSVGQKQLLCLARALLRRNKFLVLDEATSNVDMKTDAFIQRVIRDSFKDTTVITIAHRLNTIIDYDTVIVMQSGQIVENGSPSDLVSKKGYFYSMLISSGKQGEDLIDYIKNSRSTQK